MRSTPALVGYPTALELLRGDDAEVVAAGRLPAQGDLGWGFATPEGSLLRACLAAAIATVRGRASTPTSRRRGSSQARRRLILE